MRSTPDSQWEYAGSAQVAADAAAVYAVVTDIARTGQWSPRCVECSWNESDALDADGLPRVGATFTGRNVRAGREWSTTSTVVVADPGREFAWEVNGGLIRWGFALAPERDGTRLTQTWEFRESGRQYFAERFGSDVGIELAERVAAARSGVEATLAIIVRLLAQPGSPELDLVWSLDEAWRRFALRMIGLTDDELDWQPVPGDADLTLRWRLAHLAEALGASRNWTWVGRPAPDAAPVVEAGDSRATAALMTVGQAFDAFRALVADPGVDHGAALGPVAGPYATGTRRALFLHVLDELAHHAAEAALLRDLYRGGR